MKIIVLDDDPTGSQTVNNCPLILRWDKSSLLKGINDPSPLLFILTNTRSMPPDLAMETTRGVCKSLIEVLNSEGISLEEVILISRGDSTLRGHAVLEPDVINEVLGPFDATFYVPAFFEGGRTTVNGVHLLDGLPVHTTHFARDTTFGYSTSNLDLWLEEKSNGRILAGEVVRLKISELDAAVDSNLGMQNLIDFLLNLTGNQVVVVDAELPAQLDILGQAVRNLLRKKRFLFRSAASLINGLANFPTKECQTRELVSLRLKTKTGQLKPGLIMVGSHVPLADKQLEFLLKNDSCVGVELPVKKIANIFEATLPDLLLSDLQSNLLKRLNAILTTKKTPVLYSSRGELQFKSIQFKVKFGNALAELMARIVANLSSELGYVISKGGITTHVFLEKGLKLDYVLLKGQLLPGLSIVCADSYLKNEGLPIITFPGNLGKKDTLLSVWKLMQGID